MRFPLTEERVAAVQCYLRDNDPIFVRKNLKRLLDGTLGQLAVGDTVTVARRWVDRTKSYGGAVVCVYSLYALVAVSRTTSISYLHVKDSQGN